MGEYTPEQISAMEMSVSGLEELGPDSKTVASQQESLDQLSEMAEGGLTEADMAGRRQIGRDVNQSAKARQKSILSQMAQRGVLGSGMELAAQLKGEQQSINAEAEASDRLIQQTEAARRSALQQKASLSGQMRGQESQESLNKYKAAKAIEEFNVRNRQKDVMERNRAQQINLAAKQAQEDSRVNTANKQEQYNKALIQQQFQNQSQKASGLAGQYQVQGQAALNAANQNAARQAGIGGAIANMAGAVGSSYQGDADKAHEIELAKIKADGE